MAKYAGVDISKWNGNVNYTELKSGKINGCAVKFAMLRTSYGYSKDIMLDKHYAGCKAAGLYVGAYHWIRAQTPKQAREEAAWLCKLLAGYKWDYPIALDFEDTDYLELSKAQCSAIVEAFMGVLEAENYYTILYTNPDFLANRITAETKAKYDIWLAHWTHGKNPKEFGQKMWQYAAYGSQTDVDNGNATDVGNVTGAGGPIDVNWAYVGYASIIRKVGKNNPPTYKINATRSVSKSQLAEEKELLSGRGYTVSYTKV